MEKMFRIEVMVHCTERQANMVANAIAELERYENFPDMAVDVVCSEKDNG